VQEVVWSADGEWLVVRTDNGTAGAGDLVGVRTNGDATEVPLVFSKFTEMHPALSPDGRWLAYISDESGGNEVYVRPFPGTSGGRWQVSNGGGMSPAWSLDGAELFFIDNANRMVAADVRTTAGFEVVGLRPLFEVRGFTLDVFHQSFTVTADGEGFILMRPQSSGLTGTKPSVIMVQHWLTDLESRLKR
jgi:hypothetical protein